MPEQFGETGGLHIGIEGILNGDVRALGTLVFTEMADDLGLKSGGFGAVP